MVLDVRDLRQTVDNIDIMNVIRKNATVDYQRRIPEATKANVQETVQGLLNNRPSMNEFIDQLVNRIGLVLFKSNSWSNPLAKFKRGMLEYGDTIEEIVTGLLEAKSYNTDRDYLERDIFGVETPEVQTSYHKVNRQDYYKLSVMEPLLRRAFITPGGLSSFVSNLMSMPTTSDNWDEFLLTTSLFGEYHRDGGFFNVNVPDISAATSNAADSKYALRRIREYADTLKFISRHYNAAGMPVAAQADELELFITPQANAAMDVEALAAAFNIDRAEIPTRTTIIPQEHFGIKGAQAVLTTKDFFVIADQRIDTTSAVNPVGLVTNYFLHHWQVVSASRFVPALLFTTEEGTVINIGSTPVQSVTNVKIVDSEGVTATEVARGELYTVEYDVNTLPAGGANDAARLELGAGMTSPQTRVSQSRVLYVGVDDAATTVTVNAYATDTEIPQISASVTLPVVGDRLILWPEPRVLADEDTDGLFEVAGVKPDFAANKITIPTVEGVQYKDGASNVANGAVITVATGTPKTITVVAKTGFELEVGAPASWVFTAV